MIKQNTLTSFVDKIKKDYSKDNIVDWSKVGESFYCIFRTIPYIPMLYII